MLTITADFSQGDLEKDIENDVKEIFREMAMIMFEAGKAIVDLARAKTKSEGGFGNITWNLRGSIGCVLLIDHQLPEEFIYFPTVSKGEEGRQKGINFAREIALLVDDGAPVLILVAGEEYAFFVESKGKDVITGSTAYFEKEVNALLNT